MATENTVFDKTPERESTPAEHTRGGEYYRPRVDIVEHEQELLVRADMPGIDRDAIDIRFEDGTLTVYGQALARQDEKTTFVTREYGVGDFYRTFRVSEQIDAARITAEYADGVLTLRLPKAEAVRPRKIAVMAR